MQKGWATLLVVFSYSLLMQFNIYEDGLMAFREGFVSPWLLKTEETYHMMHRVARMREEAN